MKNIFLLFLLLALSSAAVKAQTTTFTYQGRLSDSSTAANGTYDLGFALFDAASGGTQIGAAITRPAVNVSNGIFTVQLDFGAGAFTGANRFLEIAVKRPADTDFTTLTPRQPVTSTPYSIQSVNAANANNALNLGGTAANQFVQTNDTRLSDARTPIAGSANYVQNTTTQQTADFNVSGTGEANVFNARTQFNIGGSRALFTDGEASGNTFIGLRTAANNTGSLNVFGGYQSGSGNTGGSSNSFFGAQTGQTNSTGNFNAFFGRFTGNRNTTGEANAFFGAESGMKNTTGNFNSFFGENSGNANATGGNNLALGAFSNFNAGNLNFATAIGSFAGVGASDTIVIGKTAGTYNSVVRPADAVQIPGSLTVTGTINGTVTNATNAANAAQLGGVAANQYVQTGDARLSNARTPTAGSANYIQNTTTQQTSSDFNISGSGTAGGTLSGSTINSATQYNIGGIPVLGAPNTDNLIVGKNAGGNLDATDSQNTLVGANAGSICRKNEFYGDCLSNTFVGTNAGTTQISGRGNTFLGFNAGSARLVSNIPPPELGTNNTMIGANASAYLTVDHATAIGADAKAISSNTIVLGRIAGEDAVRIPGSLQVSGLLTLPNITQGGSFHLCLSDQTSFQVQVCSSSLRFKTNVAPFSLGLNTIKQLKPITFDWKSDGHHDFGFGAEDVAAVDPLLAEYDRNGVISGVKYDRFSAMFVNAFKEQQTQIEDQQKQIENQQKQINEQKAMIDELKKLVCAGNPNADVCRQP